MIYEVIHDAGETPNKCTIAPLSYRSDFHLIPVKGNRVFGPLQAQVILHPQGECLTRLKDSLGPVTGIACIDCVWKRLDPLFRRICEPVPILARIPEGIQTAYPRRNEKNLDPDAGLATIEAIFVAAAALGNWDLSLLSEYYFARSFLSLNKKRFLELGIAESALEEVPPLPQKSRNSLQRRRDRGKREAHLLLELPEA